MHADLSSLDTATLTSRLKASAGEERERQVDFLLYLAAFDSRQAWREAGYGSLWEFCLRELLLREGAAGRRIGAMRALRDFPELEAPLRDGRLSLTTAVNIRPLLSKENLGEMVARAAYKTDEETRHLVASLQPGVAPMEGIRRLPEPVGPPVDGEVALGAPPIEGGALALSSTARPPSRATTEPVSAGQWSVRITIDRALKDDLDTLRCLLSHKIPDGNLAAVLREAVSCAIEKHGRRRGAVSPARERKPAPPTPRPPGERDNVPASVRREVLARDGGRCTYASPDGHRCGSRWRLEFDHVVPAAKGGASVASNLRLRCAAHNALHAEEAFGRAHMARFQGSTSRTGEATIGTDSGSGGRAAAARPGR